MEEETFSEGSPSEGQAPPQQYQQQPPPQQQQYQPQHTPPQQPSEPFFKKLASDDWMPKMVMLGLIIILLGAILISAAPFRTNYGSSPPSMEVRQDHRATENSMRYTGNILMDIGVFIVAGVLLLAAFYRDDWSKWFKIGIAGFALALIIIGWFGIGLNFNVDAGLAIL